MAGAATSIKNVMVVAKFTSDSNNSGSYTSNWDPIGTYTVTCSAPGHSTDTIPNVQITTGGLTTVNCQI